MKLSFLSIYISITIICSVIAFHNTFGLQRDEDDGCYMELQILLHTHQCVHQQGYKTGSFGETGIIMPVL